MILDIIATGSSGNSYLLRNDKECLIIEMGMPFMEVKKALDFNIMPIVGAICSHGHGDHFKYYAEYKKSGIKIFCPFQEDKKSAQFGGFTIQAFELPHGETKSYGFYIRHEEIGQLLFLTDFEYCEYDFSKLNVEHILIECNYQLDMVDVDAPNFKHKIQGHCADTTCLEFIKHNYSPHTRTISIIHTNPMSLDEKAIVERIKTLVDDDVVVGVCHPGYEIELKKEAF